MDLQPDNRRWVGKYLDQDKYFGPRQRRRSSLLLQGISTKSFFSCCGFAKKDKKPKPAFHPKYTRRTKRTSTTFNNVVITYNVEARANLRWPVKVKESKRSSLWFQTAGLHLVHSGNDDAHYLSLSGTTKPLNEYFSSPIDINDHCLNKRGQAVAASILHCLESNMWHKHGNGRFSLPYESRKYCPMVPDLLCCFLTFLKDPLDAERLLVRLLERSSATPSEIVAGPSMFLAISRSSMLLYHVMFDDLVCTIAPTVHGALKKVGLRASDIAKRFKWFERLFFGSLPYRSAVRVIDSFIAEGSKILFRVGAAILALNQLELKRLAYQCTVNQFDLEEEFFKPLQTLMMQQNADDLFKASFTVQINRAVANSYAMKHMLCMTTLCRLPEKVRTSTEIPSLLWNPNETDWIGFDMDHTLIVYDESTISEVMYRAVVEYLHTQRDPIMGKLFKRLRLDDGFETQLANVGMKIDVERGNLVKFDNFGTVSILFHGTKLATPFEIAELEGFDEYKERKTGGSVFKEINTHFEYMIGPLFAVMVDHIDEYVWEQATKMHGIDADRYNAAHHSEECVKLYRTCFAMLRSAFVFAQSRHCENGFENTLKANLKRIVPKQPEVKKWLQTLRQTCGKKIFLLTNGKYTHTQMLMSHAFGSNWESLFDVIVVDAVKGKFFDSDNEKGFFEVINEDGKTTDRMVGADEFNPEKIYANGCGTELCKVFDKISNKQNSSVMYFGDHLQQDIINPKRVGWNTGAIITEIEAFANVAKSGKRKGNLVSLGGSSRAINTESKRSRETKAAINATVPLDQLHPISTIWSNVENVTSQNGGSSHNSGTSDFKQHTANAHFIYMSTNRSFGNPFLAEATFSPTEWAYNIASNARICVPSIYHLTRLDPTKSSFKVRDIAQLYGLQVDLKSVLQQINDQQMVDDVEEYFLSTV